MRPLARLAAASVILAVIAYRTNLFVRAIRALDRRGGFATTCAEGAYARAARLFADVHRRAAEEAGAAAPSGSIVDVGSGPGDVLARIREVAPGASAIGIEPSATMRDIAVRRGLTVLEGTAESLPLESGSTDLVISTFSAHHWNDPVAAFREFGRVLVPGGRAIIYDLRFAAFNLREAHAIARAAGINPDHVRRDVLPERLLGVRPYCRITITNEEEVHAG